ncbi:unnamed protein product [Ascophyllum nodosum]
MINGEVCATHTRPVGRLIRSMEYWLEWNHLAESQAHFRIQLETVKLSEVVHAAPQLDPNGLLGSPEAFQQKPFSSKRGRTRKEVSWESMRSADAQLEARVWELSKSYGYTRDPP